ncbi:thioredoxin fold domain-containing protein [Helicobacter sp.]|uniref:thioredoxin fold domain-containing protein n=1 Tax=Helicobacter sp. TaxID=218 RepID=UPI0025BF2C0C|nr:thioredoxin fold domain-containing protein [Helicobacter sp.]MBR2494515.1 thioredoxin fold domain-containing protein [Helicobacter sp.]
MKNIVLKRVVVVYGLLMSCLLFMGCPSDDKSPSQEHSLQADDFSSYTITLHEDSMLVKHNGSKVDSAVLLVFISSECQACQGYYEHLNHLQANEDNVVIFGVLEKEQQSQVESTKQEESLASMKDRLGIAFTLLQESSKVSLLQNLLEKKQARINALLVAQNRDSSLEVPLESKEEAFVESRLDSTKLPYFVLYDTEQRFYQDYEGIVPEEIFSSDIAQLTN